MAECGACAVLADGKEIRSCITALSEKRFNPADHDPGGLPARWAKHKGFAEDHAGDMLHPVQQAWIEQQTPQCGFCQNGMMIKARNSSKAIRTPPSPKSKTPTANGISPCCAAAARTQR